MNLTYGGEGYYVSGHMCISSVCHTFELVKFVLLEHEGEIGAVFERRWVHICIIDSQPKT